MMLSRRLLEKPRFELAAKGVYRLERCNVFRQRVPGLWVSKRGSTAYRVLSIIMSLSVRPLYIDRV